MTHHPDHLAHLAHLRHAEHVRAAAHQKFVDVVESERRSRLGGFRRLLAFRSARRAYVREYHIASTTTGT